MTRKATASRPIYRFMVTLAFALLGGVLFKVLHLPIPWMLGPMIFVFIGSKAFKSIKPLWPSSIRNTGMIIAGYTFGLSFTGAALLQIKKQLPVMLLMTALLLLFCMVTAYFLSKATGIPYPTMLTGSIPGGLSQVIALAEETKGIDLTIVTFLQVSRLMMIVIFVPILIFSPIFGIGAAHSTLSLPQADAAAWGTLFPAILPFALVCTVSAIIGSRIKLPTAYLLAPLLATAALQHTLLQGPELPISLLNLSQLMIGGYVGLLLNPDSLKHKFKMLAVASVSGTALLTCSFFLSVLLTRLYGNSPATSLLSLAPGGMDQMGIIAHEINGDISIVTSYQLFRILFILLFVPPLLKMLFKAIERNQLRRNTQNQLNKKAALK